MAARSQTGVDFASSWNDFFGSLTALNPLFYLANIVALGLLLVWLWKVLMAKRGKGDLSGRSGGTGGGLGLTIPRYTLYVFTLAVLLSAPTVFGHIVLPIVDSIINAVTALGR